MEIKLILAAIAAGELDQHEIAINHAFRARRDALDVQKYANITVGTRVRLVRCQKYLIGAIGTVKRVTTTKFAVDLDHPRGRFHTDVMCPVSLLEKI